MPPARSSPFAPTDSLDGWIALAARAKRYGRTPAELVNVSDPYLAYCLDEAADLALLYAERKAWEEARAEAEAGQADTSRPARGPAILENGPGGMSLRGRIPVIRKKV